WRWRCWGWWRTWPSTCVRTAATSNTCSDRAAASAWPRSTGCRCWVRCRWRSRSASRATRGCRSWPRRRNRRRRRPTAPPRAGCWRSWTSVLARAVEFPLRCCSRGRACRPPRPVPGAAGRPYNGAIGRIGRREHRMSIKSDRWIRRMSEQHGMLEPYEPGQVKFVDKGGANGGRIVSYGTSSYGYDVRCSREFKIFTNINSTIVDPKNFDPKSFVDIEADECIIPPNSFALARTVEFFRIPRDTLVVCLGKSTYARCGI